MWINESTISAYLRDIRKIDVMTPEEEKAVIEQIKQGDEKAVEKLICANLRFVITVAKEFQNQGMELCDLINEGNYGLVKAASRYDSERDVRFFSYAVWWIRQSIIQALNDHSRTIRLPVNVINEMSKVKKESQDNEYANWCIHHGVTKTQSLNQTISEDGEELIATLIGSENDAFKAPPESGTITESALERIMDILSPREKDIIMQCFGIGGEALTLQQIADDIGLTKERVRQIRNLAINKLRYNAPLLFECFPD
jgi:RNA polymerase primary sigma factor